MPGAPPRFAPRAERAAYGRQLRQKTPRAEQGRWDIGARDPAPRIGASERGRLPELLAIRRDKLGASPFAFLRGTAAVMAPDLAALPSTGYHVQLCGDAHVRNLGAYATADGATVFDINDFDETWRGPWEWDLKRLAISIVVAGREARCSDSQCADAVAEMVRVWRETLGELAELSALEVARYHVCRFTQEGPVGRVLAKAAHVTPRSAAAQMAQLVAGKPRFVDAPPKIRRVPEEVAHAVLAALADYRETLGPARQQVFDAYEPCDVGFRVAGAGSLGGRNYMVICIGNGPEDPMILQVKQALPSCYASLVPRAADVSEHCGMRVAQGQHRMQTASDPFIGWTTIDRLPFYVRRLADHQAAIDPEDLKRPALAEYARVCGETFAKSAARTGDAVVLAGYAGQGDNLDRAFTKLALAGADQVEADWRAIYSAPSGNHRERPRGLPASP